MKKVLTQGQVDAKAKVSAMRPTEAAIREMNPKGHRRYHEATDASGNVTRKPGPDAQGKYKWSNSFKPNEGGKLTREAQGAISLMNPFVKADNARFSADQEKVERVAMRDADGGVRYVEPDKADDAAARSGWGHRASFGGLILRTGLDGRMDWRLVRDAWEPAGYLLTRGVRKPVNKRGLFRDPDGHLWRFVAQDWRRLSGNRP